jgi:hypothetical protein
VRSANHDGRRRSVISTPVSGIGSSVAIPPVAIVVAMIIAVTVITICPVGPPMIYHVGFTAAEEEGGGQCHNGKYRLHAPESPLE